MSQKRTTPLEAPSIEKHHCTIDVRLEKLGMIPFFQGLAKEALQEVNKKFSASYFAAGDTIYYQDEKATLLRVVVYGAVNAEEAAAMVEKLWAIGILNCVI